MGYWLTGDESGGSTSDDDGWVKLPNGHIMQYFKCKQNQNRRYNFPRPFPNECIVVIGQQRNITGDYENYRLSGWDKNGFTISTKWPHDGDYAHIIAIGR